MIPLIYVLIWYTLEGDVFHDLYMDVGAKAYKILTFKAFTMWF